MKGAKQMVKLCKYAEKVRQCLIWESQSMYAAQLLDPKEVPDAQCHVLQSTSTRQ